MADRNRDRHIRDSGLPSNDDSLVTIRGGDTSDSDTDSKELLHQLFYPVHPTPTPSPPRSPTQPAMANPNPVPNPGQVRP